MSACKTLIRTSSSCLKFRARTRDSTILRCFSSYISTSSDTRIRIKSHKPLPISRSFGSVKGDIPLEIWDSTEGTTPHNVTSKNTQDSRKNTIVELIPREKDDVSWLMKMERRSSNGNELRKGERWFPYVDKYKATDAYLRSDEVLDAIGPYITDVRKERFRNVVNNRSYSVCLVVEGLSDFGNVSAAFRSADALGIQSVHVVSCDSSRRYKDNRHVSMGSEKWLDIEHWSSVRECFENLKARGYRIATAHLGIDAVSVYDVDWSCATAIVVGNELRGVSKEALEVSDVHCSIPMRGMVDSFNVSVAAGLLMHQAVRDRTLCRGCHGDLTQEEHRILLAEFYLRHNENAIKIANEFSERKLAGQALKF